jgi:hypothetical protein
MVDFQQSYSTAKDLDDEVPAAGVAASQHNTNSSAGNDLPNTSNATRFIVHHTKHLPRTLLSWASQVTVELSALLFFSSVAGCGLIYQQLLLEKCCLYQLSYSKEVCSNLDSPANLNAEIAVQKLASRYDLYDAIVRNVVPIFFILFVGDWSDKHGRRPMILFCFCATIARQVSKHIVQCREKNT